MIYKRASKTLLCLQGVEDCFHLFFFFFFHHFPHSQSSARAAALLPAAARWRCSPAAPAPQNWGRKRRFGVFAEFHC